MCYIRFDFVEETLSDDLVTRDLKRKVMQAYIRHRLCFIRMRRKTSPFTAEISGEDCEAVLKTFNFSQAYFAAQYIAE